MRPRGLRVRRSKVRRSPRHGVGRAPSRETLVGQADRAALRVDDVAESHPESHRLSTQWRRNAARRAIHAARAWLVVACASILGEMQGDEVGGDAALVNTSTLPGVNSRQLPGALHSSVFNVARTRQLSL